MTQPLSGAFAQVGGPGGANCLPNITFTGTSAAGAFKRRTPQEVSILATQVTKINLIQVALEMAQNTEDAVHIPAHREYFIVGDNTYNMGDWIVQEYDAVTTRDWYRPATDDEREKYGLV